MTKSQKLPRGRISTVPPGRSAGFSPQQRPLTPGCRRFRRVLSERTLLRAKARAPARWYCRDAPLPRRTMLSCFGLLWSFVIRHSLFLLLALISVSTVRSPAASGPETAALEKAEQKLADTFYAQAEADFADFIQKFPASELVAKAILLQATARFYQSNYIGAIELLASHVNTAGPWGDQYLLSLGEAYFKAKNYDAAADAFARLVKEFPASTNRVRAAIEQANMHAQFGDWGGVTNLLQQPDGVFQIMARSRAYTNDWVVRGYLLLSEAQLALHDYAAAESTLQPLAKLFMPPKTMWEWQFLLCRIQVAAGRDREALTNTATLLTLAKSAEQPALVAQSAAFQATTLERLGSLDEAAAAYENNLADNTPAERQREFLLRISQLNLAQNRTEKAALTFERFLLKFPRAAATDLAWLTLGELRLREDAARMQTNGPPVTSTNFPAIASTNLPAGSNYFQTALAALTTLTTTNFSRSSLVGKAYLDIGWCYWLLNQLTNSRTAFSAAINLLRPSPDQAVAWFKLGDTDFRQNDFQGAVNSYNAIIEKFGTFDEVKTNLFEPALYQAIRAALAQRDLASATNAAAKLIAWFPGSFRTQAGMLLTTREISREGNPAEARQILSDFLATAPDAQLRAEIELEIAGTYEQQANWEAAIGEYDKWLAFFTNHPARPRAEYFRACAYSQSSNQPAAFGALTNLLAQFPTNTFTPLARLRVADYYFSAGSPDDLKNAEINYQLLSGTELGCLAKMMAGRVCVARQGWREAINYFTNLIGDASCPADVNLQARFAYADTLTRLDSTETNKFANLEEAIRVFGSISKFPTNKLAALASGRIGDCYLNMRRYTLASEAYSNVISSPFADASSRSRAKVGLAEVLEKQTGPNPAALLEQALAHYLDVLYGNILAEGEQPDPFWTKKAGMEAARLAEEARQWGKALNIYRRLKELVPSGSASFDQRIEFCQKNLSE